MKGISSCSLVPAGSKVWCERYGVEKLNHTRNWDKTVTYSWRWRGRESDFGLTLLRLLLTFSPGVLLPDLSLLSHCLALLLSLSPTMKIDFAPSDVPLTRRLQTASVVQWVFSFLGLGECLVLASFLFTEEEGIRVSSPVCLGSPSYRLLLFQCFS